MTNDEKQALIEHIQTQLDLLRGVTMLYADECEIADIERDIKVQEIALAALTAQPVKLSDCDFAAVSHMSGGAEDYCYGFVDGTQNAIKAILAAGYEVQE